VQKWAPSDLARGPAAIINAPLLPVRTLIGGAQYAWNNQQWWWSHVFLLGPAATGASGALGAFEGVWWVCTGAADLLTGGYFELAPKEAVQLSVQPELSSAMTGPRPAPTEDPCGRPLNAAN
jgi:hypothetical protein